jgi:electron transfer flavoprotein beta subunit
MYKNASSISERQETKANGQKPMVTIEEWNADDINPDFSRLGMSGSPTKVKSIENVVLTSKENKIITNSESEINELMKELVTAHII